jgi:hypothetical protein
MNNIHWLDFNDAGEQTPEESFEARRERLRGALIGQLSSVLHHLFPSGKILGDILRAADVVTKGFDISAFLNYYSQ